MRILRFVFILQFIAAGVYAQVVSTNPAFPIADQPLTITIDVSGTSLDNFNWDDSTNPVWVWTWIAEGCTSNCDAPTNVNPATAGQNAAKATRISTDPDKYQITFVPTTFFNKPKSELVKIGIKLKSRNWADNKQTDNNRFIEFSSGEFDVTVTEPSVFPIFKNTGESITISGSSSQTANLSIIVDGNEIASQASVTSISTEHVITETGLVTIIVRANNGIEVKEESFEYIVRTATVEEPRPAGIVQGIKYNDSDPTRVTLSFLAPQKSNVYVVGDFNDWKINPAYQLKKDGEYFWLELTGLNAGVEYAYQYLIDEYFYTADPFCDKILDPDNDQYISSAVYPNLKTYPTGKATGIVSVLQTDQQPYVWQATNYQRPLKEKLNVYELLIRDFDVEKSYQNVIDRLDYLQTLGINAIELMPIMEFSGNDSWGYNPIFYMAADKAYGTKNKLKELIDKAHQRGIAVILDMVLNQADYEFPYVKMYWDGGKPAVNSPWFNRDATHPFNVFFDFNHDSPYTEALVDNINSYWLSEYKFDGFRFDLSKGFTQTINTDVGAWSNYDQSRIDNLIRMANKIWEVDPTAYVILEHLAVDEEERILANTGMMLWGKMTDNYKQNVLGFSEGSNINRTYFKTRSGVWNNPASIVSYMESHDEERIIYNSLQSGKSSGNYNAKNIDTALDRFKGAYALFTSIPGPKMVWQFGELGYDFPINLCQNGTINGDCRTASKPIRWDYKDVTNRDRLYKVVAELLQLRNSYNVFHTSNVTIEGGEDLVKSVTLKNEAFSTTPASPNEMSVVTIANFDVTTRTKSFSFPHSGQWFDYFSGGEVLTLSTASISISLQPGEFRIYTNFQLAKTETELTNYTNPKAPDLVSTEQNDRGVVATWVDNSAIESRYLLFRKEQSEVAFTKIKELGINSTTFLDENIEPGASYDYFVSAVNVSGKTSNSDTLTIVTQIVTSVEINQIQQAVYPNPTTGIIKVDFVKSINKVCVYNLAGQSVEVVHLSKNEFSIRALPGLYILQAEVDGKMITQKIIKQ